ncbi:transposable element Tcb1 transposase [Trichonephila clavipes]|nr:transposable element Tcb1 transposase [Trichonephila clavipes]
MLPGSSTSLAALFHGCGSHLKLLECIVDGTGYDAWEDRYIVLYQQREQAHHSSAGGKSVSCCLRKADLPKNCCQTFEERRTSALLPVVCVLLTRQHRTTRLQWCRDHHNWTEQDWACVLFSDESRFSLSSDCRRQLIWRESGTAYRPENIQEKDRYPTCSIMDCLDSEGIQRLVWPAHFPDLNPIENVWDALGRQVADRNYPPTNKNTLIRALTEEWDKLPQQLLENVVQSEFAGQGRTVNSFWCSSNPARTLPAASHFTCPVGRCHHPGEKQCTFKGGHGLQG